MSEPTPGQKPKKYTLVSQRVPTPDENMWYAVREGNIKLGVPRLNDALSRLLTLSTALTGGAILWLKEVCPEWSRLPAIAMFIAALGVAVWATIPYATSGSDDPKEIAERHATGCARKREQLWMIGGLIWVGFLFAFVGAVVKAFGG